MSEPDAEIRRWSLIGYSLRLVLFAHHDPHGSAKAFVHDRIHALTFDVDNPGVDEPQQFQHRVASVLLGDHLGGVVLSVGPGSRIGENQVSGEPGVQLAQYWMTSEGGGRQKERVGSQDLNYRAALRLRVSSEVDRLALPLEQQPRPSLREVVSTLEQVAIVIGGEGVLVANSFEDEVDLEPRRFGPLGIVQQEGTPSDSSHGTTGGSEGVEDMRPKVVHRTEQVRLA
ncbi:MAG TPA: hypothetical protein VJM33_04020 [Microthrixaceae bacterium]|nr:hypothetical protein [Microthrixaceae bacterium]